MDHSAHGHCSRHKPSAFCAGRSEKLNNTASVSAACATLLHDGATNTSFAFHSKVCVSMRLRPRPSTTQYTVPSVERKALPRKFCGSSCTNAPMVGIG